MIKSENNLIKEKASKKRYIYVYICQSLNSLAKYETKIHIYSHGKELSHVLRIKQK